MPAGEILVVGAGPSGIAAACAAAESGASVVVLDDNPAPGGQIWRGGANRWIERLRSSGARISCHTRALALPGPGVLLAERNGEPVLFPYGKLILATGARELFLPFPGWTLPGVAGAGGLQALAQGGVPVAGKRVVVAGSGPLLLAVAAHLRERGAHIVALVEQTTRLRLARFAAGLYRSPHKLAQALGLQWSLRDVPFFNDAWPLAAEGNGRLQSVLIRTRAGTRRLVCDHLACGFGLVPNVELAALAGCELRNGFVAVDEHQQTSVQNILCAGEPTGIGGVDRSLAEGEIAGYVAAGAAKRARRGADQFSRRLDKCFALREELKHLCSPQTIVCRCEDVRLEQVSRHSVWRSAKLHTRCGMGPCQGRICGPALEFILGWQGASEHARPPVFPAKMGSLS